MSKEYQGYNEINKKAPRPMTPYEVSRVISDLGKNEEDCKQCPDYPQKGNKFEPCGCIKVSQENANVCVCSEELKET